MSAYEADKEALTAQFDAAEKLLKEIEAETQAMKTNLEGQRLKVEAAVEDVTAAVAEMRKGEAEVRDEMREIRSEVNGMQEMLPKVRPRYILPSTFLCPHYVNADARPSERTGENFLRRTATRAQILKDIATIK